MFLYFIGSIREMKSEVNIGRMRMIELGGSITLLLFNQTCIHNFVDFHK